MRARRRGYLLKRREFEFARRVVGSREVADERDEARERARLALHQRLVSSSLDHQRLPYLYPRDEARERARLALHQMLS